MLYSEEFVNNNCEFYSILLYLNAQFSNLVVFLRKMALVSRSKEKTPIIIFELDCEVSTYFGCIMPESVPLQCLGGTGRTVHPEGRWHTAFVV